MALAVESSVAFAGDPAAEAGLVAVRARAVAAAPPGGAAAVAILPATATATLAGPASLEHSLLRLWSKAATPHVPLLGLLATVAFEVAAAAVASLGCVAMAAAAAADMLQAAPKVVAAAAVSAHRCLIQRK